MGSFLGAVCAVVGLCILIPIVGVFSAMDSLNVENDNLRRENERLRKKGPSSGSSGGT
jgi:hypothetical protein